MNSIDRRRLTFATIFTIVALPALWVLGRDQAAQTAAPTAGAAGVVTPTPIGADAAPTTAYLPEPPVFLGGASGSPAPAAIPAPAVIAHGTEPIGQTAHTSASFHRYPDPSARACTTTLAPSGVTITVVNVDNGQSTTCRNTYGATVPAGSGFVLDTVLFSQIADLSDAPVSVRLSW
jgi:hypothetical protein